MGTRSSGYLQNVNRQDHPHAYGDKCFRKLLSPVSTGSSPRVWGQELSTSSALLLIRIIPTRMGTSGICINVVRFVRDHPHAYGDKYSSASCPIVSIGSSPRVWGQDEFRFGNIAVCGIIPTRMGTRQKQNSF